MKRSCFIIIILLSVHVIRAQPTIVWNHIYTFVGKSCSLVDYKMDSQGNLNMALDIVDSSSNNLNSAVIQFSPQGTINWHFFCSNPLNNQAKKLVLDLNDNAYLLTWDASSKNHVIKLDGTSGSLVFDYPLDTSFSSAVITIDTSKLYLAQAMPDLILTVLDLNGNLVTSSSIDFINNIYSIQVVNSEILIVGDTIVNNMQWYLRVHHLTNNGLYIQKFSSSIPSPTVTDVQMMSDTALYITGSCATTSLLPYLEKFSLAGNGWDTIIHINVTATSNCKLTETNGQLFWSFIRSSSMGTLFYLNNVNNNVVNDLTSYDSCRAVNFDMCSDANNVIYSATSFLPSTPFFDYDINAYDPINGLVWNFRYTYSNTSVEVPLFIDEENGALYILGNLRDNFSSGGYMVNVLKLNTIAGLNYNDINNKSVVLYPNPSHSRILYLENLPLNSTIEFFDLKGNKVFEQSSFNEMTVELPVLNPGMYLAKIITKDWIQTRKLILY